MPPKIFVGDVRCLDISPNECARALYGRFRALTPSCLLAQCDISSLLRFRFAVRSHCRVIILKKYFVLFQFVFYCNMPLIQFIV